MKLKALVAISMLSLSMMASAQFFPAQVQMTVLPGQVTAQVYNPTYAPAICNGQVFGQTYGGQIFNAYFAEQYMAPGTFRFAYVVTTPYLPFVNGWANIMCRPAFWY